jgi:mono/diheme cytochrome c family protein
MMLMRSVLRLTLPVGLAVAAACAPAAAPAGGGTTGGGAAASAAVAVTPELIAEGRTVYASSNCAVCHGANGAGGRSGPNLTDDTWIWINPAQPVHPQLVAIIRNGVPEPRVSQVPMPPMGGRQLTEQQLNAVAAFVGSL